MPAQDPKEAARLAKLRAREKDKLFTSEEAVAFDRQQVAEFGIAPPVPPSPDVESQVIPDVPNTLNDGEDHGWDRTPPERSEG